MLAELKTFITVSRYGTFSAAGDRLGLTQSAVSSQIRRLEEHLGFDLFDRTGRSATLNPQGRRTLQRAEELTAQFARLGDPDEDQGQDRVLRIGAISSLQPSVLARAIARFQQRHPRQRIRAIPGSSLVLMNQLDAGDMDAAVMIKPPFGMIPDFQWLTLTREPFVLAIPGHLSAEDWKTRISGQPFLRYERSSFAGRQVDRFLKKHGIEIQETIELDEIPGMLALVAAGLGVALVPQVEAYRPFFAGVTAVDLGSDVFYREIGVAAPEQARQDPLIGPLIECLVAEAEAPPMARADEIKK